MSVRVWLAAGLIAACSCGAQAGWCEETAAELYARGAAAYDQQQWNEALRWWRKTIERDPTCAQAYVGLGDVFLREGRLTEAEAEFQTALRYDPRQVDALANLGVVALQRGQHAVAVSYYRRALGVEPTDASLWVDLGVSYGAAGDLEAARTATLNALSFDPASDEARALLARLDR